jgi:hypothetical protein
MNAREELEVFAKNNGLKDKPIGWSIAADFAEWYAERKFKNCNLQNVMRSYLKEMAKKHNIPEGECRISLVDCNIQVHKYNDSNDTYSVVENIEI